MVVFCSTAEMERGRRNARKANKTVFERVRTMVEGLCTLDLRLQEKGEGA